MNDQPLIGALQACSLHELLLLTSKALALSGFGDIQILDRRESGQKSRFGGYELVCKASFAVIPVTVVVKVIRDSVNHRMLDELTTVVRRNKADFGLLVATGKLSKSLTPHLPYYRQERIIALDGASLAALLRKHRIGTRGKGEVDYAFFGSLGEASDRVLWFIKDNDL